MIESKPDLTALNYHKFKIILQISAMRHFKDDLEKRGFEVDYYALDDKNSARRKMAESGYLECLKNHVNTKKINKLTVMEPSEYDLDKFARGLKRKLKIDVDVLPCDLFLMGRENFKQWFEKQHEPVMENFYRQMRRDLNILMEGDFPIGGRWNYDLENRVPPNG